MSDLFDTYNQYWPRPNHNTEPTSAFNVFDQEAGQNQE